MVGMAEIADPLAIDLSGFDGVVVSPGVPLNRHPIADKAREAGVPIIGDIELFALARPSLPKHRVVAITGTNGKSTTTALIHHVVRNAGIPTRMRSEEHTSELQSLMLISYAVFCLKQKNNTYKKTQNTHATNTPQ